MRLAPPTGFGDVFPFFSFGNTKMAEASTFAFVVNYAIHSGILK
jgi:hypothetical protein